MADTKNLKLDEVSQLIAKLEARQREADLDDDVRDYEALQLKTLYAQVRALEKNSLVLTEDDNDSIFWTEIEAIQGENGVSGVNILDYGIDICDDSNPLSVKQALALRDYLNSLDFSD